eukprot:528130-Pleurochrysis_carterae.AAC.2
MPGVAKEGSLRTECSGVQGREQDQQGKEGRGKRYESKGVMVVLTTAPKDQRQHCETRQRRK